jgi:ribosomal protein S18 acetylase RimI-like enzyme
MTDYTLISVPPGEQRERFLPLLLLADESLEQVRSYMQSGELHALVGHDGNAVGIVLTVPAEHGAVELKAVAVDTAQQNRGIGRRLLAAVIEDLRKRGVRRAIVGTANAGIGQLAISSRRRAAIPPSWKTTGSACATWCGWISSFRDPCTTR